MSWLNWRLSCRVRGFVGGFVDGEGDVVGELHEGEFGGVLIPRQPKVIGVALVAVRVGLAWAMPSAKTNWVRSSMPICRWRCRLL